MELGGNAPFLVFADADVDAAVEGAVIAKMRNIGEACTAANRFHVAESVQDEFTEKLAAKLGAMKVGRGTEADVKVGPLIDGTQRDKVAELVQDALGQGRRGRRRRHAARRRRLLLRPDRAGRRRARGAPARRGDLRPRRAGDRLRRRGGRDRRGQRHRVRPRRLRLHARPQARVPRHRGPARPAWSASTRAWSPTPPPRSAASRPPASAARAGREGIEEYLETKYVAMAM